MDWLSKHISWQVVVATALVVLSVLLYLVQYAVYRDVYNITYYFFQDIAFVPLEVLLVMLIVQRMLDQRERRARLEKLNMVIGAFFSEVGTTMLRDFSEWDANLHHLGDELNIDYEWSDEDFAAVVRKLKKYEYRVEARLSELEHLQTLLAEKRAFLLQLLANSNVFEHESFTECLRSVFHLAEELTCRDCLMAVPESDHRHLVADVSRAYGLLAHQWLWYMRHLKDQYPYLFSLAMRRNPFQRAASPIIQPADNLPISGPAVGVHSQP